MKDTLKYLRTKNNLSQNKIADYLGISRQMYIKYESGETEPTVKCVRELSALYKVSYDVLIDDKYKNQVVESKSVDYSEVPEKNNGEVSEPGAAYGSVAVNADSMTFRNTLLLLYKMKAEDLIRVATRALRLAEEKKRKAMPEPEEMSMEEKMRLFNKLSGCIKDVKIENWKEEHLKYLDERYGV